MLETEIKKLTAAVEALTATMAGGTHAPDTQTAAPAAPAQTAAPTAVQAPAQVAPPATPAPTAAPTVPTFDEVKTHLSAVAQRMNDGGTGISGLVASCTDVNGNPVRLLSMIDPAQYADLIARANALVEGKA